MSAPGPQFTPRDQVLIETVAALRVLTTRQVQRLLFPSEQVALRRLRKLVDAGYLKLTQSVVSPFRLVTPTREGLAAVGIEAHTPNTIGARSALFLQHQLGINSFRIALGQACARRPEVDLLGFIADSDAEANQPGLQPRRVLSNVLGSQVGHVPDGLFGLRCRGRSALFFFEYDRGTEVLGNPERGVGRIIQSYLNAFVSYQSARVSELLGTANDSRGFRVLLVTTTQARIDNVRRLWANVGGPMAIRKRFIWIGAAATLETEDILLERWRSLDVGDKQTYAILGEDP